MSHIAEARRPMQVKVTKACGKVSVPPGMDQLIQSWLEQRDVLKLYGNEEIECHMTSMEKGNGPLNGQVIPKEPSDNDRKVWVKAQIGSSDCCRGVVIPPPPKISPITFYRLLINDEPKVKAKAKADPRFLTDEQIATLCDNFSADEHAALELLSAMPRMNHGGAPKIRIDTQIFMGLSPSFDVNAFLDEMGTLGIVRTVGANGGTRKVSEIIELVQERYENALGRLRRLHESRKIVEVVKEEPPTLPAVIVRRPEPLKLVKIPDAPPAPMPVAASPITKAVGDKIKAREDEVAALETSMKTIEEQLRTARNRTEGQRNELDRLKGMIELTEKLLAQFQETQTQLEEQYKETADEIADGTAEIKRMQEEKSQLANKAKELDILLAGLDPAIRDALLAKYK